MTEQLLQSAALMYLAVIYWNFDRDSGGRYGLGQVWAGAAERALWRQPSQAMLRPRQNCVAMLSCSDCSAERSVVEDKSD